MSPIIMAAVNGKTMYVFSVPKDIFSTKTEFAAK